MKHLLTVFLLLPALAGCLDGTEPTPDPMDDPPASGASFDGQATLELVEDIVYDHHGLRARHPQSERHLETAEWLEVQAAAPGWVTSSESFSGSSYDALDKGAVERYMASDYCSESDRNDLEDLYFTNLFATFPGTDPEGGHVVLGAHWDAKEDAEDGDGPIPGANDGASGVALLMRLQHHISEHNITFPFTLTMAYFDGEDGFEDCHPLAGSIYSASQHNEFEWELEDMTQFILLDMVGDPDARFIRETQSVDSDPDLVDAIWTYAATTDLADNFVDTRRSVVDDHVPFIDKDFAAIDIIDAGRSDFFPPYWHTSEDTPDKLSADMLGDMGDLLLYVLTDPEMQALLQD